MSKKHFIAIADAIREHNTVARRRRDSGIPCAMFLPDHLETLADSFKRENSMFNRERWLSYVAGACGPNGGEIKRK
jgi:hypothetical protein